MPPKKNKNERNVAEMKKDAIVAWFCRRKPETMNVIEVAIQNDWTADKSLKPGGKLKDLMKELLEEGRIQQKKCGTATVFYAFPSTEIVQNVNDLQAKSRELEQLNKQLEQKKADYRRLIIGREASSDREVYKLQCQHFEKKRHDLNSKIHLFRDNDPEFVNQLETKIIEILQGINIETENIFLLARFFLRLGMFNGMGYDEMMKTLGVSDPDTFDYVQIPSRLLKCFHKDGNDNTNDNANDNTNDNANDNNPKNDYKNEIIHLITQRPKPVIIPTSTTFIPPILFAPFGTPHYLPRERTNDYRTIEMNQQSRNNSESKGEKKETENLNPNTVSVNISCSSKIVSKIPTMNANGANRAQLQNNIPKVQTLNNKNANISNPVTSHTPNPLPQPSAPNPPPQPIKQIVTVDANGNRIVKRVVMVKRKVVRSAPNELNNSPSNRRMEE
jgi:hypothetical protein